MQGNPEEEDLFVARAALQLLAAGRQQELPVRVEDAQELLQVGRLSWSGGEPTRANASRSNSWSRNWKRWQVEGGCLGTAGGG